MEENTPVQPASSSKTLPIVVAIVVILVVGGVALAMSKKVSPATTQPISSPNPGANQTEIPPTTKPTISDAMMKKDDSMMEENAKTVQTIEVSGKSFSFTPSTIKVKQGDKVSIVFKNTGGFHDFVIDEFDVATKQVQSGASETVEFIASKKGTFKYYCSIGNHRAMGMEGTLTVE